MKSASRLCRTGPSPLHSMHPSVQTPAMQNYQRPPKLCFHISKMDQTAVPFLDTSGIPKKSFHPEIPGDLRNPIQPLGNPAASPDCPRACVAPSPARASPPEATECSRSSRHRTPRVWCPESRRSSTPPAEKTRTSASVSHWIVPDRPFKHQEQMNRMETHLQVLFNLRHMKRGDGAAARLFFRPLSEAV